MVGRFRAGKCAWSVFEPSDRSGRTTDKELAQGHNDHVEQYIRWHGLPKDSLKRWERELFNLASYFEERSGIDAPIRLVPGGPEIVSPDGRDSMPAAPMTEPNWLEGSIFTWGN